MKRIVFSRPDGGISILTPVEGARLATRVEIADGSIWESETPSPVDRAFRVWPIEGAAVEWAETEQAFAERIAAKDVPVSATDMVIVEASDLPADRGDRSAWRIANGAIIVDLDAPPPKVIVPAGRVKLELIDCDLLAPLEAWAAGLGARGKVFLNDFRDWESDHQMVLSFGAQCVPPLSRADVHAIFVAARDRNV